MQPIVMAKLKQIIVPFIAGAIGLFFYITRFPEKVFKAGSVDIVGASHQVSPAYIFLLKTKILIILGPFFTIENSISISANA